MQLAGISNITCLLARKTASVNTRATDTHTTNKNYELSWNGWTIVIEMETTLVIGGELYWYIETQYSQKLPRLLKTPCELQRVSMLVPARSTPNANVDITSPRRAWATRIQDIMHWNVIPQNELNINLTQCVQAHRCTINTIFSDQKTILVDLWSLDCSTVPFVY